MTTATQSSALALLPPRPLASIEELRKTLVAIQDRAILLTPVIGVDYLPPMHHVSLRGVFIDPTVTKDLKNPRSERGRDCYFDSKFCAPNERALNKQGLSRLLTAGGVSVIDIARGDDRKDPRVCTLYVTVEVQQLDGKLIRIREGKTTDLRAERTSGWSVERIAMAQERIEEVTETKALLRCIRQLFSLQQKYTSEELLEKPFVIPVLVPAPDMNDPEIKRMVAAKALGLEDVLYGSRPGAGKVIEAEVVTRSSAAPLDADDEPESGAATTSAPVSGEADPVYDDLPPPQPQGGPPQAVCGCPCGHQVPVKAADAAMCMERLGGSVRCRPCYPGRDFVYGAHKDLKTLEIKSHPDFTPKMAEDRRKQLAGGGR